jgi:hypothetical protein
VPIIHRGRYSSRAPTGDTEPPLYLRYAIMAVAALGADRYSHLSNEYYTNSRHLAELAGLNDPRGRHSTIPRVQTWLHLALYDLICARWALSWTNTSQAIRLLQIANVHNLDHTDPSLARNKCRNSTWSEAEEKRRAFWLAFCLDRSAFLTQGLPHLIDNRDVCNPTVSNSIAKWLTQCLDSCPVTSIGECISKLYRGAFYHTLSSNFIYQLFQSLHDVRKCSSPVNVQFKNQTPPAIRQHSHKEAVRQL